MIFKAKKRIYLIIGLILVLIANIPFFILRGGSVIPVRDQLDITIISDILASRHFFSGEQVYYEILNGIPTRSLPPVSYATTLLYVMMKPLYAYLINQLLVSIVGFFGMYIWLQKVTNDELSSFLSSLAFVFLPIYPVWGLTIYGIPLVLYIILGLSTRGEEDKKPPVSFLVCSYVVIFLFGITSSVFLTGYAILVLWFCYSMVILFRVRKKQVAKVSFIYNIIGIIELAFVYMITNYKLVLMIIRPAGSFVSHREEAVKVNYPFFEALWNSFFRGTVEAPSLHQYILIVSVCLLFGLLIYMLIKKSHVDDGVRKQFRYLIILLGMSILFALIHAISHSEVVVKTVSKMSGMLKTFQFDRFEWLLPVLWYTAFAVVLTIVGMIVKRPYFKEILAVAIALPILFIVAKQSVFKDNALELFRKESNGLTWEAFFSEKEYKEVADYIKKETGCDQNEYRVGNLGLEPAVAVFNGFYTVDGYSTNYDLEYKHKFRKAIARELEKNDYNKQYFDEWGNRCYLFSSEYTGNPFLSKYTYPSFKNLELDTDALKEINCKYLLAAGEIVGAEEKGYRLCKIFDAPEYTYFIYLYEVL